MGKWRRNKIQQDNSRAEFTEPMAEVTVVRARRKNSASGCAHSKQKQ